VAAPSSRCAAGRPPPRVSGRRPWRFAPRTRGIRSTPECAAAWAERGGAHHCVQQYPAAIRISLVP